jgi:hypothetical protein
MAILQGCVSDYLFRWVKNGLINNADIAMVAPLVATLTPDLSELG